MNHLSPFFWVGREADYMSIAFSHDSICWGLLFLKINTWGYSTINFFAPMSRYASDGGGPLNASREFKEMVKALHGAGIEVYCVFHSPKSKICNIVS